MLLFNSWVNFQFSGDIGDTKTGLKSWLNFWTDLTIRLDNKKYDQKLIIKSAKNGWLRAHTWLCWIYGGLRGRPSHKARSGRHLMAAADTRLYAIRRRRLHMLAWLLLHVFQANCHKFKAIIEEKIINFPICWQINIRFSSKGWLKNYSFLLQLIKLFWRLTENDIKYKVFSH